MANNSDKLRKNYEFKLGKKLIEKLSDEQILLLSKYYNSLSKDEQKELDVKIFKGDSNELSDMAEGFINESNDDDEIEPEEDQKIDDLLKQIREEVDDKAEVNSDKKSGAIVVLPKKKQNENNKSIPSDIADNFEDDSDENLVEEEIDSRILEILGLTEVTDFTYGEYKTLLRERAAAARMGSSNIPTESVELITNEFKRVKNKEEGKFRIKSKTININSVFNNKEPSPQKQQLDPKKLLPPGDEKKNADIGQQRESVERKSGLDKVLTSILGTLNDIKSLLNDQLNADQQASENMRRSGEISRKRKREDDLESKGGGLDADVSTLTAPAMGFFETIKRYFGNILAGSFVVGLLKWLTDPANKKSVDNFKQFFINQGPLILGGILALAALPVASTLLSFTGAILGGITSLISAIPHLKAAILGLVAAAAGSIIPKIFPETVNQQEKKTLDTLQKKYKGDKQKMIKDLKQQKSKLNILQTIQGVGNEIDEQISFLESGRTKMYGSTGEDLILEQLEKQGLPKEQLNYLRELYKIDKAPKGSEKLQSEADKKRAQELSSMTPEKLKELFEKGKSLDLFKAYKGKGSDSVKIPGLGTIVAGTNWFGGRQRKYFDENGKEISEEEMNQKYRLYSAVLEKRKKDKENQKTQSSRAIPGLPPSAAQPGMGPAGNLVGSASPPNQQGLPSLPPTNTMEGQSYGASRDGGTRKHAGVDFDISGPNAKFYSRIGGVVVSNPYRFGADGWATDIFNQQLGVYERIAEANTILVKKGQTVQPGQAVAQGESGTGVIHYEIRTKLEGGYTNSLDPIAFLRNPTTQQQTAQLSPSTTPGGSITPGTPTFLFPLKVFSQRGNRPLSQSSPMSPSSSTPSGGSISSPAQTPVPYFSSEDPNNVTTMVVKGIYNVIG